MRNRSYALAEQLIGSLEEIGCRDTLPRRKVVEAIALKGRHFTAEELQAELPSVGRATIFRSLKLLVQSGALCRVLLEDGNLHYQLSHRGHHHHLLCVECGESQDLVGCDVESQLQSVSTARGFQLSGHWLEVYGRCRDCLNNQQGKP